jgi:membrane dipeptidase
MATAASLCGPGRAQAAEEQEALARGRAIMRGFPNVDVHSHAGRFFAAAGTDGVAIPSPSERLRGMGISGVLLSGVADLPILASGPGGLAPARAFRPGEAFAEYRRQIALLRRVAREPKLRHAGPCRDVGAPGRNETTILFAIEGGDFIEDQMERIAAARADGVRAVTIIHYAVNQIGDPQTAAPVHGGLSTLGRRIVRELGDAGILVDLSHASIAATRHAVSVASRPMLLSHSNIGFSGLSHPRLISLEHARMVTQAGGLLGLLPGGTDVTDLASFTDLVMRTVEVVGIDHVGIGTDMDYTFRSVIPDYRHWPLLVAALDSRGVRRDEIARIMGGNFLRLLADVAGGACDGYARPSIRPAA